MAAFKGREFLLKIGDGGGPETFTSIGAARAVSMTVNNNPVDATTMDDSGIQNIVGDAGVQSMSISIEGVFKDAAAEETLRGVAFSRANKNYELLFPNGDDYAAAFVVQDYERGGSHDGLETFRATLVRDGSGTYTAA